MSINDFLEKENLELLWEVLIDEPLIKQLCDSVIKYKTLMHMFQSNLNEFFITEKNNCNNLIELNKKYILLIINYVIKTNNNNQPAMPAQTPYTTNQYKKIKIHEDEPVKQSITFEDIQNDRMNFFEKELNKKQEEFTNAMTLPVPPVPNFTDKLDEPMSEIELEIKRIQEQRNYDIEMINNKNTNSSSDANWLKPQETSIKNEKLIKINNIVAAQNNGSNSNNNKHISWEDEQQESVYELKEEPEEINIFGKLKKITSSNDNAFGSNYQLQIDDLKKEISALNEKLDLILQKL
jgi:hypothetical protein